MVMAHIDRIVNIDGLGKKIANNDFIIGSFVAIV